MAPRGIERFNTPCNLDSCYHDLKCGHRVKTAWPDHCGPNCKASGFQADGLSFICEPCVIEDVRIALDIAELVLKSGGDLEMANAATMSRAELALVIAKKQTAALKAKHQRVCLVVEKLDPLLQYYAEIPEAQIEGGLLATPKTKHAYKRPLTKAPVHRELKREDKPTRRRSRSPLLDQKSGGENFRQREYFRSRGAEAYIDDLIDHLGGTRVGLEKEDEATAAVRKALMELALEEGKQEATEEN